jgi:hypothetical protein
LRANSQEPHFWGPHSMMDERNWLVGSDKTQFPFLDSVPGFKGINLFFQRP